MFRLVGSEVFHIGKNSKVAEITISSKGMSFEYTLTVDGKPLKKFVQAQAKNTRTWLPVVNGTSHRVVLGTYINVHKHYCVLLMSSHIKPTQYCHYVFLFLVPNPTKCYTIYHCLI